MAYKSHTPRCECAECKATGCGAFAYAAFVPDGMERVQNITDILPLEITGLPKIDTFRRKPDPADPVS